MRNIVLTLGNKTACAKRNAGPVKGNKIRHADGI
jgi:hypothetical protein